MAFVRASSFRHVFGTAAKNEGCYTDMKPEVVGQAGALACNHKYFASALSGGGGPIVITPLSQTGRQDRAPKKLAVHKGKVQDFEFNPFNSNMIGTVSEDCYVKATIFPEGGLTEDINESTVTMEGHQKKIISCHWHPTAANIFGSASQDNTVKVWDVEQQAEVLNFDTATNPHEFSWNSTGSLLATPTKDKFVTIVDPRAPGAAMRFEAFAGSKQSSVRFMDNHGSIACIGFTKQSGRVFSIWDPKNLGAAMASLNIDQSAGVLMPHYDPDNSIMYMGGKGDGGVKYFEITNEAPYAFFLAEFRTNTSQKGLAYLPKRAMDTKKCEVMRCLRLMRDQIVPVSFCVPRKSDMFQKDIFPDTADTGKSTVSAADWVGGKDGQVVLMSMNPKDRGDEVEEVAAFEAKKSPAELKKELEAAHARIKELEAEVAKLKA